MWKSCRLLTIVLAAAVGGIIALALLPYFLAFVVAPERALAFLQASYQANSSYENTLRLMAVALADLGREEKALEKVKEFLKLRPQATLDDWKRPNSRSHPHVAERREHMRATLKRLGVPESGQHASARP